MRWRSKHILETTAYGLTEEEKVLVIKNCLDQEGLQFIPTSTHEKKEKFTTTKGLSSVLSNKFKPKHNRIIISLQYHNLHRKGNEPAHEWMGRLWTKAAECKYIEYDRFRTEQYTGGFSDEGMLDEISREEATLEYIGDATSEHVLIWDME